MSQFIKFYFTSSVFNTFRTLIHPSSGTCDFSIVSPHWLCVLVSMSVGVSVWLVGVVSVWQAFIKFYFTSSMLNMFRTLIHPSSGACDFSIVSPHWSCVLVSTWWYNRKVAGSWWWMYQCPKHVEHRRSEIKLKKLWCQVGLLFFNYSIHLFGTKNHLIHGNKRTSAKGIRRQY